jgi:hypothetical protein
MNFAHLYPPSDWPFGWVIVVAVLACMVAWGFIHPHPGMAVTDAEKTR